MWIYAHYPHIQACTLQRRAVFPPLAVEQMIMGKISVSGRCLATLTLRAQQTGMLAPSGPRQLQQPLQQVRPNEESRSWEWRWAGRDRSPAWWGHSWRPTWESLGTLGLRLLLLACTGHPGGAVLLSLSEFPFLTPQLHYLELPMCLNSKSSRWCVLIYVMSCSVMFPAKFFLSQRPWKPSFSRFLLRWILSGCSRSSSQVGTTIDSLFALKLNELNSKNDSMSKS